MNDQALKEAYDVAQRILRTNINSATAYAVLGTYFRATQQFQKAPGALQRSLELQPGNPDCYRELALISLVGGDYESALKHASTGLLLDPRNSDSHFVMGLVRHMRKEYALSSVSYQEAITQGGNDSLITTDFMVHTWIGQDQFDKALDFYKALLAREPNDYRVHYWMGRVLQSAVRIGEATQTLNEGLTMVQKALELDPSDAQACAFAGLMYTRLGKYAEGETMMKKALDLNPNSAELLYRQAGLYSIQKKFPNALNALKNAVNKRLDFSRILNPDLAMVSNEPGFSSAVTKSIEPPPAGSN